MKQLKEILRSPLALMSLALIVGLAIVSTSQIVNGDYGFFTGTWPIILGATFFMILGAYGNAIYDAWQIDLIRAKTPSDQKVQTLKHPKRFLLRAFAAAVFSMAVYREFSFEWIMLTVYQGSVFWLFFDPFLSVKRGLDWHYLSVWYRSSWLDRIFKGRKMLWIIVKLVLCGVALTCLIIV